jgi:hypothetical protein
VGQHGLEDGGDGGAHHILLLCLALLLLGLLGLLELLLGLGLLLGLRSWRCRGRSLSTKLLLWGCRRRCLLSRHLGGLDRPQRHLPLGL